MTDTQYDVRRRLERLDARALAAYQLSRLNELLKRILPHNRFYASKLGGIQLPLTSLDALEKIPVIETLYTVSGKIDMIAIVTARNAGELDHYLDQISAIPGIQSTETAIVLTTRFSRS